MSSSFTEFDWVNDDIFSFILESFLLFVESVEEMEAITVEKLKGVGKKTAEDLQLMGIETIEDLLFYFPYRYNITEVKDLTALIHDEDATIVGEVIHPPSVTFRGKVSRAVVTIQVGLAAVKGIIFNRPFVKDQMKQGMTVTLTGKWDAHRLQITVKNYHLGAPTSEKTIEPLYSVKGNIKPFGFKKLIKQAIDEYLPEIEEIIPEEYLSEYKIPIRHEAVRMLHLPENDRELLHAKRRFTYEEFLLFQLKLHYLKMKKRETNKGIAQHFSDDKVRAYIGTLPFTLTNDQQNALKDILQDMRSSYQMSRLLQGDVGSGKTAVASVALYATILANHQGALMVPTEILAEQHYQSLREMFDPSVYIVLLTSSVKGKKRKEILRQITENEAHIIIGTHSLIQDEVKFHQLGLIIIDEQHRFGVEQRRTLRKKGLHPDVLFMTATPIPRTLAITAFGDIDVSTIKQLPSGRKAIETHWVTDAYLERILAFVQKNIDQGEQAYFVTPLIEESDVFDYQNAVDLYEQLIQTFPAHIKIGLLHGKMAVDEKEQVMKAFVDNDIQILVSTTVIEVGVNVPNATTMVIIDAERFGLSQLHQLRGRVGRGSKQSYCILVADPKGEVGKERMQIMTETNDGFELSEADLRLRGPGDFFGNKQSGVPEFKVADLVHDFKALNVAREDAAKIIYEKRIDEPAFEKLKAYVVEHTVFTEQFD